MAKKQKQGPPDIVREYLASIGQKGGQATSEAKVEAARENGKKGGRPRKPDSELKYPRRVRPKKK